MDWFYVRPKTPRLFVFQRLSYSNYFIRIFIVVVFACADQLCIPLARHRYFLFRGKAAENIPKQGNQKRRLFNVRSFHISHIDLMCLPQVGKRQFTFNIGLQENKNERQRILIKRTQIGNLLSLQFFHLNNIIPSESTILILNGSY